jgi:putative PEP-CTERM system TPR-repeat lipoprotein
MSCTLSNDQSVRWTSGLAHWRKAVLPVLCCASIGLSGCNEAPPSSSQATPPSVASSLRLERNARIIEFKNTLQNDPYAADARFGLGSLLIEQADMLGGERELKNALEFGMDPNRVLPALAHAWNKLGRSKELIETYANTQLSNPAASAELKAALATAYANLGESEKARSLIEAALKDDPQSPKARVLQAQVALADQQLDKAMRIIEETLAAHPKTTEAWSLKADILLMVKGDVPGATAAYETVLTLEPWNLPVHAKLVTMAIEAKDLATAQTRLNRLAETAPQSLPHRYFTARLALAKGDVNAAQEQIKVALIEYPKDLRALLLSAEMDLMVGSRRTAEEALTTALMYGPRVARTRYLLAKLYLQLGSPEKARVLLEPLLLRDKNNATALGLSAEAALQAGETLVATKLFERAAAADPANPRYRTTLAMGRIANGDLESGFSELESAAATDPTVYSDMALLSARLREGDLGQARIVAERVASKQPTRAMPQWVLGQLKRRASQNDEARQYFERALELDKAFVPAAVGLAEMDLEAKDANKARQRFEGVLILDPNNLDALLALAEIQHRAGGSNDSVTAQLEKAVRLHPGQARARLALIDHLLGSGETASALVAAQTATLGFPYDLKLIDALARAELASDQTAQALSTVGQLVSALPRSPQPHLRKAEILVRRGEIDSAISSLNDAIRLDPSQIAARVRLTELATAKKDWRVALRAARDVQAQFPKDPRGLHLEGLVHFAQKKWDPALEAFRKAQLLSESSERALQLHTTLRAAGRMDEANRLKNDWLAKHPKDYYFTGYLGELALVSRDFPAAEGYFKAIVEADPVNVNAMNNLAWALIEQSKPGAVDVARKAAALQPARADVQDTLSMALANENQLPAALHNQKKTVDMAPDTPGLRLNLARLAMKSGDFALARVQLDKLSALGNAYPAQTEVWTLRQQLP